MLPKGEFALVLVGSANRDPAAFDHPDRLRPRPRRTTGTWASAFGLHHCLGAPLARLEAQVAIPALLRRAGSIELATGRVRYRENVVLRGLAALPVRLAA